MKKIPVLMYHRVHLKQRDFLTVSVVQLEQHLNYLKKKKFNPISILQWLDFNNGEAELPSHPIIITFDDAHISFAALALPILNQFNFKSTLFVPTALLGTTHIDCGEILSEASLKRLAAENPNLELALHTHQHKNLTHLSETEVESDLWANLNFFKKNQLTFTLALAYPYGARPKSIEDKNQLIALFERLGIKAAFRIGNRLNPIKIKELYDINRTDIRGTDSYLTFLRKINFGRIF